MKWTTYNVLCSSCRGCLVHPWGRCDTCPSHALFPSLMDEVLPHPVLFPQWHVVLPPRLVLIHTIVVVAAADPCLFLAEAVHQCDGASNECNGTQQGPNHNGNQRQTSCERQHIR